MKPYPTLRTERLVLREFTLEDAPELHRLAQAGEVARMMLHHPHPYVEGMAEEWISGLRPMFEVSNGTTFALELRQGGALVGTVSLYTRAPDGTAVLGEKGTGLLGFWLGVPYWGKGYATEAVAEVVRYGFEERGLRRIRANHFGSNAASGKVLRKVGMSHVGTRPKYYEKWGSAEDREEYVLLAQDWGATERRCPSDFLERCQGRSSQNLPSRDCLEITNWLRFEVSGDNVTRMNDPFWALGACQRRAIQRVLRISRQSLHALR